MILLFLTEDLPDMHVIGAALCCIHFLLHRLLIFATGAFVIGITALDSDEGFNGQVTYYLNTSNEYFSINATTGVITTRQTLTSSMTSQFSLIATAADMVQTHSH